MDAAVDEVADILEILVAVAVLAALEGSPGVLIGPTAGLPCVRIDSEGAATLLLLLLPSGFCIVEVDILDGSDVADPG